MTQRRPKTDGLPSLLNGNKLLKYKRYQSSKSSRFFSEKASHDKIKLHKPESSTNFGHPCAFHKETLEFYCCTHKEPACIVCASTMHKVCNVVSASPNGMKSSHASINLNDVELTIEVVKENIEKIKFDREENLLGLLIQKNAIEKELLNTRKKMNERLDRLEKEIMGQLNDHYRRHKKEIEQLLKELSFRKHEAQSLQNALIKAKNLGTDVEEFIEGKRIERKIYHEEKHISNFYDDDSIKNISFEFKLNPIINSFLSDIKTFGDITTHKLPSKVNLTRHIHKHLLPDGLPLAHHINYIKLRLYQKTYNATGIQDISAFPDIKDGGLRRQNTM